MEEIFMEMNEGIILNNLLLKILIKFILYFRNE